MFQWTRLKGWYIKEILRMLSALLLWGMAVEAAGLGRYRARGAGLVVGRHAGAGARAAAGAGAAAGRHPLVAWRHRSAAPPLSAGAAVMLWREYWAFVGGFVLFQPWARYGHVWPIGCAPSASPSCWCTATAATAPSGGSCGRALEAAGHVVATLAPEPPWGIYRRLCRAVARSASGRVRRHRCAAPDLVAHSMGGLVSRACTGAPRCCGWPL